MRKRWAQLANVDLLFLNNEESKVFKYMPYFNIMIVLADSGLLCP